MQSWFGDHESENSPDAEDKTNNTCMRQFLHLRSQLAVCFRYAKSSHSRFARQHVHKLIPVYRCRFVTIVETCICRVSDAITS
jgi:hypothetical protein